MNCDVSSNISLGNFDWCYRSPGKWILSLNDHTLYPEKKVKVSLFIIMNHILQNNTHFIYIYNMNNVCLYYSKDRILNGYNMTFKISEENLDSGIVIQFLKNPSDNIEGYNESPSAFKKKLQLTHEFIYNIPDIRLYGEHSDCNICLDNVDDNLRYISPCGHLFHMNCIWKHIIYRNMFKKNAGCTVCYHSEETPTNFTCPVCNELIVS